MSHDRQLSGIQLHCVHMSTNMIYMTRDLKAISTSWLSQEPHMMVRIPLRDTSLRTDKPLAATGLGFLQHWLIVWGCTHTLPLLAVYSREATLVLTQLIFSWGSSLARSCLHQATISSNTRRKAWSRLSQDSWRCYYIIHDDLSLLVCWLD